MGNRFVSSPLVQHPTAWWTPIITLAITVFGIIFLGWHIQPIVYFFWWEVILMITSALIRMFFSLNGQPFFEKLLFRLGLLAAVTVLGILFVMLSVTFTINAIDNFSGSEFRGIAQQIKLLQLSYLAGIIVHFFANGRYKTANPFDELSGVFIHLLILLSILQAFTMHLIPRYPHLNQAMWVVIAVVVIKFLIDLLFAKIGSPMKAIFSKHEE
jgi:small neutral amino acid transporter SnatA (MarC family)